ncbi:MAG: AAA family ATPase [Acidimicrobiales bacterium]
MAGPLLVLVLVTGVPGAGKSTVADAVGARLGAAVLAHDWAMSGLRPYPALQRALDEVDLGHRVVGWSVLAAMARAELRRGRSVVLDGVARAPEIEACGRVARDEAGELVVVATVCSDPVLHRSRVEGRRRAIPDWYELEWAEVERSAATWAPPSEAALIIDTARAWDDNAVAIAERFG